MKLFIICAALISSLLTAAALEENGVIVKLNALNGQYRDALDGNSLLVDNYKEFAADVV